MDNILGKRLRTAREKKGYSQLDVAKLMGVTNSSLSNYERGDRDPDSSTLIRLADLYEVSTDYLLGRDEIDVQINIDPDRIRDMSDVEKLASGLLQSLNQALADGVLTEEQVKLCLDVAKQTMLLMIEGKKG